MYAVLLNESNLDRVACQLSDGRMCDVLIVGGVWPYFQMTSDSRFGNDVLVICALIDGKILERYCYYSETMADILESACNLLYQYPSESDLLWRLATVVGSQLCT